MAKERKGKQRRVPGSPDAFFSFRKHVHAASALNENASLGLGRGFSVGLGLSVLNWESPGKTRNLVYWSRFSRSLRVLDCTIKDQLMQQF